MHCCRDSLKVKIELILLCVLWPCLFSSPCVYEVFGGRSDPGNGRWQVEMDVVRGGGTSIENDITQTRPARFNGFAVGRVFPPPSRSGGDLFN